VLKTFKASLIIVPMQFIRAYVMPFLVILTFTVALLAVSARIFLPSDMIAPAPMEQPVESAMDN